MKISNGIITVLVVLNLLMGIKIYHDSQKHKNIVEAYIVCKNKLAKEENTIEYFEKSMEQQRETWNRSFSEAFDNINLGTGTNLCLRISFRNCSKCVETELENLKTVTEVIGLEKIILLVDFQDSSQMNYYIKEYELPYRTIYCKHLNVGIEAYNNPYYFVANNNEIQYPFLPLRERPELFRSYIQNVLPIFHGFNL